jgi:hypothetical protein
MVFACENQAEELNVHAVVGKSLFEFIGGTETQHLYMVLIDKVRKEQGETVVPFRCDSPSLRRFMELRVSYQGNGTVRFAGRLIREETRDTVTLLDDAVSRNDAFIRMCSWCKKVAVDEGWVEVEEAVNRLRLFESEVLPKITHGVCEACSSSIRCGLG